MPIDIGRCSNTVPESWVDSESLEGPLAVLREALKMRDQKASKTQPCREPGRAAQAEGGTGGRRRDGWAGDRF